MKKDVPGLDGYNGQYDFWQDCECAEQRKRQHIFKSSQMSDWMKECGFKKFERYGRPEAVQHAYECAVDFYRGFKDNRGKSQNSIAMLGKPGSGKTHLLSAVSNCLMIDGVRVLYFPHVEGMNELKEDFERMPDKLNAMKRVDVLYWDDLFKGRETPTNWQLETIFEVVNYRYLNNLPFLISSERTIDEMLAIDEAIGSRIYSMCKRHLCEMKLTDAEKAAKTKLNYRLVK